MSEQRLENSEQRLTSVEGKVDTLETKVDRLETKVDRLETKVDDLRVEMLSLNDGLRTEMHTLGRQMRVLHEEVLDRIAALSPDYTQIRREFTAADATLRDDMDKRLVPLEAFARQRRRRKPH